MKNKSKSTIELMISSSAEQMRLGFNIRAEVFVREQGVQPHVERDGKDQTATHYLAKLGDAAIGTARSRVLNQTEVKVERVAIIKEYRSLGLGFKFMQYILTQLSGEGVVKVTIHAQADVVSFYRKLGFISKGLEFIEAGIIHQEMSVSLTQTNVLSNPD
ncbi:MAG TPA: GNAT family N-acetyltransferase [Dehalococcoidia bacterium]|jgi:predicted GNAT family N-acyltransferase|nr:GNAT family N-acetyltransferase [Dehalococcoidia bacterium]